MRDIYFIAKKKLKKAKNAISELFLEDLIYPIRVKNKTKFFCIGRNKTGTTSLRRAFWDLGLIVGNQRKAEFLLDDYIAGNFEPIIQYCRSAQVFQDVPFSLPETYKYLDKAYPNSKFILSIRDTPEQWYESVTRFAAKIYGSGKLPTTEDLKNAAYVEKGWAWKIRKAVHKDIPENDPYHKPTLIQHYINYNKDVMGYFEERDCLLVLNLSEQDAYSRFCDFVGVEPQGDTFPHENKTSTVKIK